MSEKSAPREVGEVALSVAKEIRQLGVDLLACPGLEDDERRELSNLANRASRLMTAAGVLMTEGLVSQGIDAFYESRERYRDLAQSFRAERTVQLEELLPDIGDWDRFLEGLSE